MEIRTSWFIKISGRIIDEMETHIDVVLVVIFEMIIVIGGGLGFWTKNDI